MSSVFFNWIVVLYAAGLVVSLISSIQSFFQFRKLKKSIGVDMFHVKPEMKLYLIAKPIFWPYYFVTEKSPIERLSELFFKHYGDAGHTYFYNQGIKNFLNDVFRGKNRYKDYQTNRFIWALDLNGRAYQEYIDQFGGDETPVYAAITYARYKEKYRVGVTWGSKECLSATQQVSRFALDACEPMNVLQLRKRLFQINPVLAQEFFSQLN